jgi:hypothetical protein
MVGAQVADQPGNVTRKSRDGGGVEVGDDEISLVRAHGS